MIYRIRLGTFTKRQQILKKQGKHWTNSTEKHKYASSIRKYWVNISVIAYFIQKFFRNCIFIENKCIKDGSECEVVGHFGLAGLVLRESLA